MTGGWIRHNSPRGLSSTETRNEQRRELREHSGVDPEAVASGGLPVNRADRRMAAKLARKGRT